MASKLARFDVRLPKSVMAIGSRIASSAGVTPGQVVAVMLATYRLSRRRRS